MPRRSVAKPRAPRVSRARPLAGRGAYYRRRAPVSRQIAGRGAYYRRRLGGRGAYNAKDSPSWSDLAGGAGRKIGGWLGAQLDRLVGNGDYRIHGIANNNALTSFQNMPASFGNADDSTIITHCEYLFDVIPSTNGGFATNSIDFNPGEIGTLPIGSNIMCNFDKYELLGCVYFYRSMSGNALNSVNTALGTVVISVDYDINNNPFKSKTSQEQISGAISCKPSESVAIAVECKPSMQVTKELYMVQGSLPFSTAGYKTADQSTTDDRFYYHHRLQVSSQGLQTTTAQAVGEIWVAYKIRCVTIAPSVAQGKTILRAHYEGNSGISTSAYFGTLQANSLGPVGSQAPAIQAFDNIGLSFSNTVVTFPSAFGNSGVSTGNVASGATLTYPFYFKMTNWYNCASGSNTVPQVTVDGTNIKIINTIYNGNSASTGAGSSGIHSTQSGTNAQILQILYCCCVSPGGTLTFSSGTLTATVTAVSFEIDQWNAMSEFPNDTYAD